MNQFIANYVQALRALSACGRLPKGEYRAMRTRQAMIKLNQVRGAANRAGISNKMLKAYNQHTMIAAAVPAPRINELTGRPILTLKKTVVERAVAMSDSLDVDFDGGYLGNHAELVG